MKNLFTLTVIAILSSILLSSCGSGMSITKRRYTKGYYVNRTPKPADTKEAITTKNPKQSSEPVIVQVMPEVKKNAEKQTVQNSNTDNKNTELARAVTKKESVQNQDFRKQQVNNVFSDFSIQQPFKTIDKAIDTYKLSADSDDDGLSLFWIIILVLLILWALGFISGNFGGVVHVLLIIALVLLILWLLKVL